MNNEELSKRIGELKAEHQQQMQQLSATQVNVIRLEGAIAALENLVQYEEKEEPVTTED